MLLLLPFLLAVARASSQCGDFTTSDQLGPYFDAGSPYDYKLAPEEELADPTKLAVLQGKITDGACRGLPAALVEVWYAGGRQVGGDAFYTHPTENGEWWYRGKAKTDQDGNYKFMATFPGIYTERPIIHYHFKVSEAKGMSFISQSYFKDKVPTSFEEMTRNRPTQFAKVEALENGRKIVFNIKLKV